MKGRCVGILILMLVVAMVASWNTVTVVSIPNTNLVPHQHKDHSVMWPAGNITNPDNTAHNHRSAHNFYGATGSTPSGNTYDAYAVWDNRDRREDDAGTFDLGHGLIDEVGYGGTQIRVRYKFSADPNEQPPGTVEEQDDFRVLVHFAFSKWEGLSAGGNLVTLLGFTFVNPADPAEIVVKWTDCDDLGTCGVKPGPPNITFDKITDATGAPGRGGWSLWINPASVPSNEYHFLSTALHEVGHVVGLDEQNDTDDVMIASRVVGCPQNTANPGTGPCFSDLDNDSREGALDLYSIPTIAVGGVAELPEIAEPGAAVSETSQNNYAFWVVITAGATTGAIIWAGAVWYTRRRWLS